MAECDICGQVLDDLARSMGVCPQCGKELDGWDTKEG